MEFWSGRKSNIFIIAGMEISIWTVATCLFSFFPLQELMHYSSYRCGRDQEVLPNFLRSLWDITSKKLLCVSCNRCESSLKCINKRTKGWSSADGDAEEVNNPASEWCGCFISALSRFTLEIPPAKLSIAIPRMRSWSQVRSSTGKGSAARMKRESQWEKDTELEKKPRELAGDIGWVGARTVASASEPNCCHSHTFKSFRGSCSS